MCEAILLYVDEQVMTGERILDDRLRRVEYAYAVLVANSSLDMPIYVRT